MKIGFIGLGNMGGPMALNLMKAGHELLVHDVRREMAAAHLDKGARWAASPRDAAADRELILTRRLHAHEQSGDNRHRYSGGRNQPLQPATLSRPAFRFADLPQDVARKEWRDFRLSRTAKQIPEFLVVFAFHKR